MQLIDLSHNIEQGMPCYPGTPEPEFHPLSLIEEEGFAEQLLTISSHTGTHVDLPSHIISSGASLDAFGIERFAGKGVVIDVRAVSGGIIGTGDLQPFQSIIKECEFVLLCSGWSEYWGSSDYFRNYPVLSNDAARWLAGLGLKGIGVDMISLDQPDSADFPVHRLLLQNGLVIIENLASLLPLMFHAFTFCCFPLKIVKAEASPVRAVAFIHS
ncbi:MAG: cyclase family protein [Chlorobium sp.]